MFECSVYGILRRKPSWNGKKFTKIEKKYNDGFKTAVIETDITKKSDNKQVVIIKEAPDRNKQRTSIVCKITKLLIEGGSVDNFLVSLGYSHICTSKIEGYTYLRNGYKIQISKVKKDEENLDSSEEADLESREISNEMLNTYLLKIYMETESIIEGERLIDKAFKDMNGEVNLYKPNLNLF